MNTENIKKVLVVLFIVALILLQAGNVKASGFNLNEIYGEDGSNSSLEDNSVQPNNTITPATNNNTVNNVQKNNATGNKTVLPETGANENAVIALIVVFSVVGVYTFKKVKDYNM